MAAASALWRVARAAHPRVSGPVLRDLIAQGFGLSPDALKKYVNGSARASRQRCDRLWSAAEHLAREHGYVQRPRFIALNDVGRMVSPPPVEGAVLGIAEVAPFLAVDAPAAAEGVLHALKQCETDADLIAVAKALRSYLDKYLAGKPIPPLYAYDGGTDPDPEYRDPVDELRESGCTVVTTRKKRRRTSLP